MFAERDPATPLARAGACLDAAPSRIVGNETGWRRSADPDSDPDRVSASRWSDPELLTREPLPVTRHASHTIAVALRGTALRLEIGGQVVQDGYVSPGAIQLTQAGLEARAVFRKPSDILHLYLPRGMLPEWQALPAGFVTDPVAEQLARALLAAAADGVRNPAYLHGIGIAIIARLREGRAGETARPRPARAASLPKWRLHRVIAHVAAHIDQPLHLRDLAAASGLTPMYFAAGFRAATGLRPHEYVLRHRIECAQDLMTNKDMSLVQIALATGFQSQSHFSTRFKHVTGMTPRRWRMVNCAGSADGLPAALRRKAPA